MLVRRMKRCARTVKMPKLIFTEVSNENQCLFSNQNDVCRFMSLSIGLRGALMFTRSVVQKFLQFIVQVCKWCVCAGFNARFRTIIANRQYEFALRASPAKAALCAIHTHGTMCAFLGQSE